jgi:hypothetical protein
LRRIIAHSNQSLRRRVPKPEPKAGSQAMSLHEEVTASIAATGRLPTNFAGMTRAKVASVDTPVM